jgi:hypothetical protein
MSIRAPSIPVFNAMNSVPLYHVSFYYYYLPPIYEQISQVAIFPDVPFQRRANNMDF